MSDRKPSRPRSMSRAAMARRLAEIQAERAVERVLPPELAELVDGYTSPTLTAEKLAVVRPFLRKVVTASTLQGVESVRKHCTHIAALAGYGIERGLTLEPAAVLTTAFIDEYVRLGMAGAGDTVRAERRRRLLALAATVNPGPTTPARLTPIPHATVKPPYTPQELAVIKRVACAQPTPARSRNLSRVVALGAGAGLDSVDQRDLHVEDIDDQDDDGLLVDVHGPRPRVVPLRRHMEGLLREALVGAKPTELVLGQKQDRRNTAARAVQGAALYRVPHIEPARLRATWLADLMTDTIPLAVILQAAGLKSARTLADLLPHLGPWCEYKGLTVTADALRGGAR